LDITRIRPDADSYAEAFDTLARALDSRLPRRQIFSMLATSVAAGVLGTASRSHEAAAKGKRGKRGKKRRKRDGKGNRNDQGTTSPPLRTCTNAADCGTDTDGSMCACRTNSANQQICTKINGRFLANGTCADCQGVEQCIPVVSGGIECILPCGAS
jgi:hypothetical protein